MRNQSGCIYVNGNNWALRWRETRKIGAALALLLLCILPAKAQTTTTVTGRIQDLGTSTVSSGTFIRFYLRGCGGNQPRVNGTALIAPTSGNVYYKDFVPSPRGVISGTLYSTRNAAGTGNGSIECGGSFTSVWYGMQPYVNGKAGPETPIHAKQGATIDISSISAITTNPVVVAPTGDSTYARLDGGNQNFTGAIGAPIVNGIYSYLDFGIKCDGVTDDQAGLNNIGTLMPAGGYTVQFPSNATCLHSVSITTWGKSNLRIIAPNTRFKFTSSSAAKQINLHASREVDGLHLELGVLQGNSNSTYGLWEDSTLARGDVIIGEIQDQATACAYLTNFQIMNNVDVTCSRNKANVLGTSQTTTPANGVILGDTGQPFINNRKVNITAEGITSGIGLWLKNASESVIMGTSEGNAIGSQCDSGAWNTWQGFDAESNSTEDYRDACESSKYVNSIGISTGTNGGFLSFGTIFMEISGGKYSKIVDDAHSTFSNLHDLKYVTSISGFGNVSTQVVNAFQQGTTVPYFNTAAPANFQAARFSSWSSNAAARNWCLLPEGTGMGYFELWMSTANTTKDCVGGSAVMQFINSSSKAVFPTFSVTGTNFISTIATGTAPLTVTSTTPVSNLAATPTTYNAAGTQQTNAHVVEDTCTLGTNCAVTFSGSAAFTSSSSYSCVCTDQTATAACRGNQTAGNAVTFTGTGTDVLRFVCVGK